jgi:hypothetical protein
LRIITANNAAVTVVVFRPRMWDVAVVSR